MVLWEKNWNFNRIIKDKQNLDGFKAKKKWSWKEATNVLKLVKYLDIRKF